MIRLRVERTVLAGALALSCALPGVSAQGLEREIRCDVQLTLWEARSEVVSEAGPVDHSGYSTVLRGMDERHVRALTRVRDTREAGDLVREYLKDQVELTALSGSERSTTKQTGALAGEAIRIAQDGSLELPKRLDPARAAQLERDLRVDLDFGEVLHLEGDGASASFPAGPILEDLWVTSAEPWKYSGPADSGSWPWMHLIPVPKLPPDAATWLASIVDWRSTARVVERSEAKTALELECEGELCGDQIAAYLPGFGLYEGMEYEGELTWTFTGQAEFAWEGELCRSASVSGDVAIHLECHWEYSWETPRWEDFTALFEQNWKGTLVFTSEARDIAAPEERGQR